jgi:hypothetical protein
MTLDTNEKIRNLIRQTDNKRVKMTHNNKSNMVLAQKQTGRPMD